MTPRVLPRRAFLALGVSLGFSARSLRADTLLLVPVVSVTSELRDIQLGTLENIFLGRPVTSPTGDRFVPFNHPPRTLARTWFDQRVLRMDADQVARHWVDQRVRADTRPPRTVPNVELLREVVAKLPGAVSYLAVSDLDSNVRALSIGGASHQSLKFPLR